MEGRASDVVFADDDGCLFVRSEKCRGVICNRPGNFFWAAAATSGSNQGRAGVARTIGLRPLPSEANSRPQSHISRSPAKHRRRHRRKRFLLIFYPFRSSRRFLLQSAVLRPLTVPLPMALISRYVDPIAGSSLAGGTSPAPSRYRRRAQD